MDSRKIIRLLEEDGWYKTGQRGSHLQFLHPLKKERVTVVYPRKDIPLKTLISIEKQSGLKLR